MSNSHGRRIRPGRFAVRKKALQQAGTQVVLDWRLREIFARDRILKRAESGELGYGVVEQNHPAPPLADEPECTLSQYLRYYDENDKTVAYAHRYLRPDGTIGLSGQPDPKEVFSNGVHYFVDLR